MRVGISGFGRIGKIIFRIIEGLRQEQKENLQVVAINCPSISSENLQYLINYDTVHSYSKFDVKIFDDHIIVNGQRIHLFRERDPKKIDWHAAKVECVVDSTGAFRTQKTASAHLKKGVKKVVITAPSSDIPMFVMGVNQDAYDPSMRIVSNASCTTNCLAPLAKVVHEHFHIQEGFLSTIHSITSSQNTLDGRASKNIRIGRSCQNIIPSTTGATKALGVVVPELNGKISGMSYRVPTNNVSVIDFSFRTATSTTYDEIVSVLQSAAETHLQGILRCSEEELVSSDFIGDTHSTIVDVKLGQQIGERFFKIVAWYDNEWGYSYRVVDLIKHIF